MILSDIVNRAIQILGLENEVDVAVPSAKLTKLTDCANMIYSELTLEHVHLRTVETLNFEAGRLYYTEFASNVREVLAVKVGAAKVPFVMYPLYVYCENLEGEAQVEYVYHLGTLTLADTVILPPQFTVYTLALGTAGEYYYRIGLIDEALFYKTRYDNSIANLSRRLKNCITPKRRLIC